MILLADSSIKVDEMQGAECTNRQIPSDFCVDLAENGPLKIRTFSGLSPLRRFSVNDGRPLLTQFSNVSRDFN